MWRRDESRLYKTIQADWKFFGRPEFVFFIHHLFTLSGFSAMNLLQSGLREALAFSVVCLV